jgi:transcriptional antiterminator Rof (Rho-off)
MKQANAVSDLSKLNIPAALHEIGMLLELKGGRYFQARAYKTAARVRV